MTLYVYELNENSLITHDGEVQLGHFNMKLQDFLKKVKVDYTVSYWLPDPFVKRYKRVNYQNHLRCASIGTKDENGR
jgi:hypothetical protein